MANSDVLRLDKVSKSFGGLQVLADVDLSVGEEEIVGLIGPNGAGKSTLFNVITSFYTADRGDIYLRGERITGLAPHKVCHKGIARTFQLVKTFLKMTVFENAMVGAVYGQKHQGTTARTEGARSPRSRGAVREEGLAYAHVTLSDRRLLEIAMALGVIPVHHPPGRAHGRLEPL